MPDRSNCVNYGGWTSWRLNSCLDGKIKGYQGLAALISASSTMFQSPRNHGHPPRMQRLKSCHEDLLSILTGRPSAGAYQSVFSM